MTLRYPVNYIAITQYYKKNVHNGIDLGWNSAHGGNEQPIYSAADGEVIAVKRDYNQTDATGSSYGNYIKIRHTDGFYTLYAHLKYDSVRVNVGDHVTQGQYIANMGRTGRANGNHLHYEVFINDEKVNPEIYTYVFEGQITSSNPTATEGLLYYKPTPEPEPTPTPEPEPKPDETEELKKLIKELEDKIALQNKEIASLKEQLKEQEENDNFVFTYNVEKTSLYEIQLYDGEKLLIK